MFGDKYALNVGAVECRRECACRQRIGTANMLHISLLADTQEQSNDDTSIELFISDAEIIRARGN